VKRESREQGGLYALISLSFSQRVVGRHVLHVRYTVAGRLQGGYGRYIPPTNTFREAYRRVIPSYIPFRVYNTHQGASLRCYRVYNTHQGASPRGMRGVHYPPGCLPTVYERHIPTRCLPTVLGEVYTHQGVLLRC